MVEHSCDHKINKVNIWTHRAKASISTSSHHSGIQVQADYDDRQSTGMNFDHANDVLLPITVAINARFQMFFAIFATREVIQIQFVLGNSETNGLTLCAEVSYHGYWNPVTMVTIP